MEVHKRKLVFILDCDGTLTDGKMHYTSEGKIMKTFGCDDHSALKAISSKVEINFITADKRGFDITKKRIEEDMHMKLDLVSDDAISRWEFIRNKYPSKHYKIIFMGDGIFDHICLKNAELSFTVKDALKRTLDSATVIINRRGGDRAVAEACLVVDEMCNLKCFE